MNPTPVQEELVHPSTRSRICAALEASVEMEFAPLGEVVWVSNSLLSSRSRLCLMPATSRPASKGGRSAGHRRGWLITDEGRGALRGGASMVFVKPRERLMMVLAGRSDLDTGCHRGASRRARPCGAGPVRSAPGCGVCPGLVCGRSTPWKAGVTAKRTLRGTGPASVACSRPGLRALRGSRSRSVG